MASPACPAPMTTVVILRTAQLPDAASGGGLLLVHLDRDVRRVGDDVKDRRTLLRLGDQGLDLVLGGVGIDVVGDLDAAEAVADVAVDAEDALQVHGAFDGR